MAFVVQCGGDILCEDSIGGCNVTLNAMGECIQLILLQNLPTIFLGGGILMFLFFFYIVCAIIYT